MSPGDSSGAMIGMVAALLLVVGVVAAALVLKKQGIIGKGNPEVPKSGVTTDPEAHLSDITSKKEAGKQVKLAKTKSASQDSKEEEMDKDSGRLPAGTQLGKGLSPLNTDIVTESVEVAMDNENSTSDRKPETPKKSEKPSFDGEGEPKKRLEGKSLSTEGSIKDSNAANGKSPEQLGGDTNNDSVKSSHPSKQEESKSEVDSTQMAAIPPKPAIPGPRKAEPNATTEDNELSGATGRKSVKGIAKQRPEQKPEADVSVGRNGRTSVRSPPKQPAYDSSDLVKTNELPQQAKEVAENTEFLENEYNSVLEFVRQNIKKETTVAKQEQHKDHNRYTDIGKYSINLVPSYIYKINHPSIFPVPFDDNFVNLPPNPDGEVTYVNASRVVFPGCLLPI